jgi:hypothetical protein
MLILSGLDLDQTSVNYKELVSEIHNQEEFFEKQRKKDRIMLDRANEWYLRAEVVKLTSHGISMTILSDDPQRFEQEVMLIWPEHHQLQLHAAKPSISLFTFYSPHASRLSKLRKAFYHRRFSVINRLKQAGHAVIAAQRISMLSNSSGKRISMPESLLKYQQAGDIIDPADKEYLLSLNPNADQLDLMLEKFNIGGKSGAPLYFSHDLEFVIKAIPSGLTRSP